MKRILFIIIVGILFSKENLILNNNTLNRGDLGKELYFSYGLGTVYDYGFLYGFIMNELLLIVIVALHLVLLCIGSYRNFKE